MSYYRRKLPHWDPTGKALFITWRLHGSIPAHIPRRTDAKPGEIFRDEDRACDKALVGPLWLKDEAVAQCVVDSLWYGADVLHLYELVAYVVMANHVHMLIRPNVDLSTITRRIKGFTGTQANKILGRTGKCFWQTESFDHWIRSGGEFDRIVKYIEDNPVSAGLVEHGEDWRWSSAWKGSVSGSQRGG